MLNDGTIVGIINLYRADVKPFTDRQIGLVQNFAVEAVLAMENARPFKETREALQQQVATAEPDIIVNNMA